MAKRYNVTLQEAEDNLTYDPGTGVFRWKKSKGRMVKAGDIAGSVHSMGYRRIGVCGALVLAHRLAWLMHHKRDPTGEIDHINGDRDDNRIENLRDVSSVMNNQNRVTGIPTSRSGIIGVFADKEEKVWGTHIRFKGRTVRVFGFPSIDEAHEMYLELRRRLHDGWVEDRKSGHPEK